MDKAKIIYLDEYRKTRLSRQRRLRAMIEGHLVKAGLLDEVNCICGNHSIEIFQVLEDFWEPWDTVVGVETKEQ